MGKIKKEKQHNKSKRSIWPIQVFFIALFLSIIFSTTSQLVLSSPTLIVALLLLFVTIAISIVFDIVGAAVASCEITPFYSMAARKIKGAKKCIQLLKNSNKVISIVSDVVGDICGILSGAMGAGIVVILAANVSGIWDFFLPVLISGLIASVTIGSKAFTKSIAINNSQAIVFFVGKLLSVFSKRS